MTIIGMYRKKISDFFSKGSQRSIEAKKNIIGTVFIKGVGIVISLLMVPVTIHYINLLNMVFGLH